MFNSSILGQVKHPLNILTEYLELFNRRHKIKAAILSWLDSWYTSGHDEWVYICNSDLADTFGVVPFTIRKHLTELTQWGILKRRPAKRWPTDKAYSYSIDLENLGMVIYNFIAKVWLSSQLKLKAGTLTNSLIGNFLLIDESILTYRQVKNDLSTGKNCSTLLNQFLDSSLKSDLRTSPPTPQGGEEGEGEDGPKIEEEDQELAREKSIEEPSPIPSPTEEPSRKPLTKSNKGFGRDKYSAPRKRRHEPASRHPALVWAGEATPWLVKPEREGDIAFRAEFLEFHGQRWMEKFEKADLHEAIGDFRASLINKPEKCQVRWDEYASHIQHHAQNMVARVVSGGTVQQKEINKIEANKVALNQPIPVPTPALPLPENVKSLAPTSTNSSAYTLYQPEKLEEEEEKLPTVESLQSMLASPLKVIQDFARRQAEKWGFVIDEDKILELEF